MQVAVHRDQDANPKEAFIYHAAGLAGAGGSSYIHSVILRDRDNTSCGTGCDPWTQSSDGTLEERRYHVQNWRADVTTILKSSGEPVEWLRYTAYGTPTVHPIADINGDGDVDSADVSLFYSILAGGSSATSVWLNTDLNRDDVYPSQDDEDYFLEQVAATGGLAAGFDKLSTLGNRKGYAGYERDESLTMYHVRHRVLDSKSGKWTRKDPLGYVDGVSDNAYARSIPVRGFDPSGLRQQAVGGGCSFHCADATSSRARCYECCANEGVSSDACIQGCVVRHRLQPWEWAPINDPTRVCQSAGHSFCSRGGVSHGSLREQR
jgi:RHS repeat-associated protein